MSYSVKMMIVFVFFVFVLSESSAAMTAGKLDVAELIMGREELVKWAGYGEDKLSTVIIDGKILCHGAHAQDKTSLHPYPVSGATVVVLCGTEGKTQAKGITDSSGNFLIDLPSHLHAIPNLENVCCVNVVHLPETSACQQGKHKGIKLSSIGEGIRSYTAHNVHLMPRKHT